MLRIYPALFICFLISLLMVFILGYLPRHEMDLFGLVFWSFTQLTFMQFYNPEFMRGFGTGVLNGSLWTITVELQFYCLVPLLYKFFIERIRERYFLAIIAVFWMANYSYGFFKENNSESFLLKLIGVSFIPWFYMFLVGVFFQRNKEVLHKVFAGKWIYCLSVYVVVVVLSDYIGVKWGNSIGVLPFTFLTILIFSFAYSFVGISEEVLKGNDISYGVYIYHMPIINVIVFTGVVVGMTAVFTALTLTIAAGMLSWFLIEKRFLHMKKSNIKL